MEDEYEKVALNCFRFFHFTSFSQVDDLTPYEYRIMMEAHELEKIDREYEIALQAWENNRVKATKGSGRSRSPVYKTFKSFFDKEERYREVKKAFHPDDVKPKEKGLNFKALIEKKKKMERKGGKSNG